MIGDITYPIGTWPKQNELTHITEVLLQALDIAIKVLVEVADLAAEDALAKRILSCYEMLLDGSSLSDLCVKAELNKHGSMHSVI